TCPTPICSTITWPTTSGRSAWSSEGHDRPGEPVGGRSPRDSPLGGPHFHREALMMSTSLLPRCLAGRKESRSKRQTQRVRFPVEGLEDRVVPSAFPSTANGIHVLEDQLPGGLSGAMVQFVATHTDGTQKELLSQTNPFRAINPNFTVLHYQLGTGNSAYDYIINDQWASDFSHVNQQESWFAHQSASREP